MSKLKDISEQIANAIIADLITDIESRKGLGNEWENIDEDVKDEIRNKWKKIIKSNLE